MNKKDENTSPYWDKNGITVKDLKKILERFPEQNSTGEDTTVWIETSEGYSNQLKTMWKLNEWDILLSSDD